MYYILNLIEYAFWSILNTDASPNEAANGAYYSTYNECCPNARKYMERKKTIFFLAKENDINLQCMYLCLEKCSRRQ